MGAFVMNIVPREQVRLLTVDSMRETMAVTPFGALAETLGRGDVLVVNDAATLPASIAATTGRGESVELRLFDPHDSEWSAIVLGPGDWRQRTEDRPPPPVLEAGSCLRIGSALEARIVGTSTESSRLLRLHFEAPAETVWRTVYQRGAPVQYAYRQHAESLWAFQNVYASRPWAAEHVSAGRALTWQQVLALRSRGVKVVALTEGAGLSSSGHAPLDALLPLPERYELPALTAMVVNAALASAHRVVAVGTSVMRALESAVDSSGQVVASNDGRAALVIDGTHRRRVVSALLTGIHSPQESHYRLLESLLRPGLLQAASDVARREALQEHEAGDAMLVLAPPIATGEVFRARWL